MKLQVLTGLLRSWGYDDQDFVIEEDHTEALGSLFGLSGGVVKVSRRSTGECRMYATGIESAWISALLLDLARGHLADGPETAPAPRVNLPAVGPRSH
jgi:hypothetical protein